jgi:uncharacterized protein
MNARNIAVIGSGISGLSAAWLLSQRHHVTLIESEHRIGGHSNTVTCQMPEGDIAVDTGFIVYNEVTYKNLTALFDYLNVPVVDSNMGFAVSLQSGQYEYSGAGLGSLIGHVSNLAKPKHWRMMVDMTRFFKSAVEHSKVLGETVSLQQYLKTQNYSQDFLDLHLLPVAGAIWSSEPEQMLNYPAKAFIRFFENHGLLNFLTRPQWRTVNGGSTEYVKRLLEDGRMRVLTGCPVQSVVRDGSRVVLLGANGFTEQFDAVVIATHADVALAILDRPTHSEQNLLSRFSYSRNKVTLHSDESFMPKRKRLWSSWNYVAGDREDASVTYWMNSLQPLQTKTNLFVSLNAKRPPREGSVLFETEYAHPIFNAETRQAQTELWSLQGQNNTWFCGAHFGAGFHEDGLQAGLAVAEQLGGLERPWDVPNKNDRIFVSEANVTEPLHYLEAVE